MDHTQLETSATQVAQVSQVMKVFLLLLTLNSVGNRSNEKASDRRKPTAIVLSTEQIFLYIRVFHFVN